MKAGFNWKHGPFEMIDALGCDWFMARLTASSIPVPPLLMAAVMKGGFYKTVEAGLQQLDVDGSYKPVPRISGAQQLSDCKRGAKPLARNGSASVWDIGDGVACLEFHSKMNSLDPDSLAMVQQAVDIVGEGMKRARHSQRGREFFRRRQHWSRPLCRKSCRVANAGPVDRPGPVGDARAQVCKVPCGGSAKRHGLGRRL